MINKVSYIFVLLVLALPSSAQQILEWQRHYGGSGNDRADAMVQTLDGGFILLGTTSSSNIDVGDNNGASDYWLVKTDDEGLLLWEKNLGGAGVDEGRDVVATSDGGYLLIGSSPSSNGDVGNNYGNYDYWVVKTNAAGNIEWETNLGGTGNDRGWSAIETADGNYAVLGHTYSNNTNVSNNNGLNDYWMIKLDGSGSILFEKNFGGSQVDPARSIQQTLDGGYIIAGYSKSSDGDVGGNYGDDDCWIVKTDDEGLLLWEHHFGGSDEDIARVVRQTMDGGYIVGGTSQSDDVDLTDNKGAKDAWVFKLHEDGTLQWQKNFGGSATENIRDIQQTADGGYILAGDSSSSNGDLTDNKGNTDVWLLKIDALGNLLWQKNFGGSFAESAEAVVVVPYNAYVVAGYSRSSDGDLDGNHGLNDYWMFKIQDCVFPDSFPRVLFECVAVAENEMALFDLNQTFDSLAQANGLTISWFADAAATTTLNDPSFFLSSDTTVFLQFTLGPCLSETYPIELKVRSHSDSVFIDEMRCEDELPIVINDLSFDEAGTYIIEGLTNSLGCDSIVILNLEIVYFDDLVIAEAGADQIVDEPTASINGNLPTETNGLWSSLQSSIVTNEMDAATSVTDLEEGNNLFVWSLQHPLCGTYSVDTIQIFYEIKTAFFLPNTFTPNGDGDNDLFTIPGLDNNGITTYQFRVFNRWGNLVFERNNYQNDWDGRGDSGKELLEGTYYFILIGENGSRYEGPILLVR